MNRAWQKRCLLLCVLTLLSVQQLSAAHVYEHLSNPETGECLDCDALNNFKVSLPLALPLFNDYFDALDPVNLYHLPTGSRCGPVALIRAPPAPKVL